MDWPDADGHGAHFDKRFVDDCRKCRWDVLAGRYGWASVSWITDAWAQFGSGKGGGR